MSITLDSLDEVLRSYPPMVCAFAYGSGVVEQGGYDYSHKDPARLPMLDMIFVVEDSVAWHSENMLVNADHYTSIVAMNPTIVTAVQENFGAHVWFNAFVPMNTKLSPGRMMKYGVISCKSLLADLKGWKSLYIAGRLHKPVLMVKCNTEIEEALEINKRNALRAALLLMPRVFSETDLYLGIASLSYIGDPRMIIGENPKKIINLVTPIVPHYRNMYQSALRSLVNNPTIRSKSLSIPPILKEVTNLPETIYLQEGSRESRWSLCLGLPLIMRRLLFIQGRARFLKEKPPTRTAIRTALASIVARSASVQSAKGLFTIGFLKSASYIFQKMSKRIWGK